MLNKKTNKKSGLGIIEVLIGTSIFSLAFFGLLSVAVVSHKLSRENINLAKASFLIEEGVEAVKIMRDKGWSANIDALTPGANYYLQFDGVDWSSTTTPSYVDGFFERKFSIQEVYRDANDDIAQSGVFDPGTKKLSVSVSWFEGNIPVTKQISTYITNIFE